MRRSESTIEPDRERFRVPHGVPESLRGLARQQAPRGVGNGAGNDQRDLDPQLVEQAVHREDGRLRIQHIEYGLDEEQVDTPHQQRATRFHVRGDEIIKRYAAIPGVVDIGDSDAIRLVGPERRRQKPGDPRNAHACRPCRGQSAQPDN